MFNWLEKNLPKVVLAPALGLISWVVYGFILWTLYISLDSTLLCLFAIIAKKENVISEINSFLFKLILNIIGY